MAATAKEQAQVSQKLVTGVTHVGELSKSRLTGADQPLEGAQAVTRESSNLNEQLAFFS